MADNTLHLNLKKKWFDMILNGEKTEEYRDIKPYWNKRFWHLVSRKIKGETYFPIVDTITFSNGYSKTRPQFVIEIKKLSTKKGVENWGAEKGKDYHVLELGKIISLGRNFQWKVDEEFTLEKIRKHENF